MEGLGVQYRVISCFLASFLLSWGALSTYWKKKGTDAEWWNWFLHGFGIGLAMLPFVFIGLSLNKIIIRALAMGVLMMIWSEWHDDVVWEECGRGACILLTLPILFI